MKNLFSQLKGILLIGGFISLFSNQTYSNHIAGGEITYKCIDASSGVYKFKVVLYRYCAGEDYSNEQLQIRTSTVSTAIPLTLIAKENVTPVCQVPDVSTPVVTNCPSGPIVNNIKGVERWIYEATYTIGKNKGIAYVGWTKCCRNSEINTAPSGSSIWIQAVINTNYINNSVDFNGSPFPHWCAYTLNTYSPWALDSIDSKFITINGQSVLKDSISYQLFLPFTDELSGGLDDLATSNPHITLNPTLNVNHFLYTTNGVTLDPATGLISCVPSQEQDAILAMAAVEYRAIPNQNGIGYSRVFVGYSTKDIQFTVKSTCFPIQYLGIVADSSNVKSVINNNSVSVCSNKKSKIVFKFKIPMGMIANVKEDVISNSENLVNYTFNKVNLTSDTLLGDIEFDGIVDNTLKIFKYELYYCNSIGLKIKHFVEIKVNFYNSKSLALSKDTIYHCLGSSPLKLEIINGEKVKWSPHTYITSAQSIDSSWVNISPTSSIKYYYKNIDTGNICYVNDSIYIKVVNCDSISGYLFVDKNKNCIKDTSELPLKNTTIQINGVSSAYERFVATDSNGFFYFKAPINNSYTFQVKGVMFNCDSTLTKTIRTFGSQPNNIYLPVKDSAIIEDFQYISSDVISICDQDSFKLNYSFTKSIGTLKSIIYYGNGDSSVVNYNVLRSFIPSDIHYKYNASGNYNLIVKFYGVNDSLLYVSDSFIVRVMSCVIGRAFVDFNKNCMYDIGVDSVVRNYKVTIFDSTLNKLFIYFTNNTGEYRLKCSLNSKGSILVNDSINCNQTKKIDVTMNSNLIIVNIPLNPRILNSYIKLTKRGTISNTKILSLDVSEQNNIGLNTGLLNYTITLPPKSKYNSALNATNISNTANKIYFSQNHATLSKINIEFDSLINTDTLCFSVRLHRVGIEMDTNDNVLNFCAPALTSFDPNDKTPFINSMDKGNNFTEKKDVITYAVRFQNTGNAEAKNIKILDQLDSKIEPKSINIIGGSHPFTTEMNENNELMFSFDNINLPDSNTNEKLSHGYVIYSVKAKESLQYNDVIENTARIYFDYNSPVLTNTTKNKYILKSSSAIEILRSEQGLTLYPNPAFTEIQLLTDMNLSQAKVSIYSIDGKIVTCQKAARSINIEALKKGIYILNVSSENGTQQAKFVKE